MGNPWQKFEKRQEEFLEFAVDSAKAAGKIHMDLYNSDLEVEWTSRAHFRTEADIKVSAMLRARLANTYPAHSIHSEESEDHITGNPFTWVIDELDGTISYVRRFDDNFCFAMALCINTKPVLGVVYMPHKGLMYTGLTGQPSRLNGKEIRVSNANSLNKVIMTFYSGKEVKGKEGFRASHIPFLVRAMESPSILTDIGCACAAASLCFVADGRIESCLITGSAPEDIAAASVILRGAGAMVTNLKLEPWQIGHKSILTANPVIHGLLADKLKNELKEHIAKWGVI